MARSPQARLAARGLRFIDRARVLPILAIKCVDVTVFECSCSAAIAHRLLRVRDRSGHTLPFRLDGRGEGPTEIRIIAFLRSELHEIYAASRAYTRWPSLP